MNGITYEDAVHCSSVVQSDAQEEGSATEGISPFSRHGLTSSWHSQVLKYKRYCIEGKMCWSGSQTGRFGAYVMNGEETTADERGREIKSVPKSEPKRKPIRRLL